MDLCGFLVWVYVIGYLCIYVSFLVLDSIVIVDQFKCEVDIEIGCVQLIVVVQICCEIKLLCGVFGVVMILVSVVVVVFWYVEQVGNDMGLSNLLLLLDVVLVWVCEDFVVNCELISVVDIWFDLLLGFVMVVQDVIMCVMVLIWFEVCDVLGWVFFVCELVVGEVYCVQEDGLMVFVCDVGVIQLEVDGEIVGFFGEDGLLVEN